MRSYLDLLMHLLLMPDTFQRHRLVSCLKGKERWGRGGGVLGGGEEAGIVVSRKSEGMEYL